MRTDRRQRRDASALVLLGLFFTLAITALMFSGRFDSGFWLWLDRTPR